MPKGKCIFAIITVRNSSCGKVMFSQVSVCPQGGRCTPLWQTDPSWKSDTPWADTPWQADTPLAGRPPWAGRHPPQQTATAADGTHPTGMHSCLSTLISGNMMKATNLAVIILHLIILFIGSLTHTYCLITHLCVK